MDLTDKWHNPAAFTPQNQSGRYNSLRTYKVRLSFIYILRYVCVEFKNGVLTLKNTIVNVYDSPCKSN
jgi:hypothetical protein